MSSRIELVLTMKTKSVFISSVGSWLGDFLRSWLHLWIYGFIAESQTTQPIVSMRNLQIRLRRSQRYDYDYVDDKREVHEFDLHVRWRQRRQRVIMGPSTGVSVYHIKLFHVTLWNCVMSSCFFCLLFLEKIYSIWELNVSSVGINFG